MKAKEFRVLAAVLGATMLVSPASAAVHHHGPIGISAHRSSSGVHAFHGTAAIGGRAAHRAAGHAHPHLYSYARRGGHRYAYGGAVHVGGGYGTYIGGGYAYPYHGASYGYRHFHHSCWWYYHHEPYSVPSWCGSYGYSYSYGYGGPSYVGSYGHGYLHGHRQHYAWSGEGRRGRQHPSAFGRAHASRFAHIDAGHHFATQHLGGAAHFARVGGHPKIH